MPRIEIELTSSRPDGTWTWRAAGARQPKGTLDGSLLDAGAKVGDLLRADTEQNLDGIRVMSVLPPKAKRADPERLALLGPPERDTASPPQPSGRAGRERRDGDRGGPRPDGRDRAGARPDGRGRDQKRPRRDREAGDDSRARGQGRPSPTGRGSPGGARRDSDRRPDRTSGSPRPAAPTRARRLHPGRAHREAILADLALEQRPVAEQVLRGGIPAVRQAVDEHNAKARAAGEPEIKSGALVAMAEELLPRLRAAEWHDRADAAMADIETVSLRDLRAIVAGSEAAARDESCRELATRLREAAERRSTAERETWLSEIGQALDDGRVVRALRISSRPPEPGQRFPTELGARLGAAAGAAMAPHVAPDRWAAVLDAVVSSPVRLSVQPEGLPAEHGEALTGAARRAAPRVPALRNLLGPPPPRPARPRPTPPPPPPPVAAPEAPPRAAEQETPTPPAPAVKPAPVEEAPVEPAAVAPTAVEEAPVEPAPGEDEPVPSSPTPSP